MPVSTSPVPQSPKMRVGESGPAEVELCKQDTDLEASRLSGPERDARLADRDNEIGKYETIASQALPEGQKFTYPDGGKEAWLCLAGGICAMFCSFGLVSSGGAFQQYYETNLLSQYSSATIAWTCSTTAFVSLGAAILTGSLFDLYGHKPLVGSGTVILVLAYSMLSLSTRYYQILLCHFLSGVGNNFFSVGALGHWFDKKRGMAFGLMMSSTAFGAVVWPILLATLPQKIGFGWNVRLVALICGVLGTTSFFLLRTRLTPKPPGRFFYFKAFKNPVYVCLVVAAASWAFAYFTSMTFVGTYGRLLQLGDITPYLLVIASGASGFGRLLTAVVADRVGPYNTSIIANVAMIILFFCWMAINSGTGLIVINVLYGLASGGFSSLQAPLITRTAVDMRFAGTMVGQMFVFQAFAQLVGPPIAGALFGHGSREEQLRHFPRLIILGGLLFVVSTIALLFARLRQNRTRRAVL